MRASIVLIALIFTSCLTEKNKQEICQHCPIVIKDSIREVTKITPFDTTLFISQLGKDIQFDYTATCCQMVDELNAMLAKGNGTITEKQNGIKSTIFKANGKVVFRCAADSLNEVIRGLRVTIEKSETKIETKVLPAPPCEKQHRTRLDEIARWWLLISVFILLLLGGWKFGPKLLAIFKKPPL